MNTPPHHLEKKRYSENRYSAAPPSKRGTALGKRKEASTDYPSQHPHPHRTAYTTPHHAYTATPPKGTRVRLEEAHARTGADKKRTHAL